MSTPNPIVETFTYYCKLTCARGSEHGECKCKNPAECEMKHHPLFATYRDIAQTRIILPLRKLMRAK